MKKQFILFLFIIGISIMLKAFVFSVYYVISGSMEPTLLIGDKVLIKKIFLSDNDIVKPKINPGDIIVFKPFDAIALGDKMYIKRIAGMPGDTVEIINGLLIRNGNYEKKLNLIYRKTQHNIIDESDFRIQFLKDVIFPGNKEISYSILNFGPLVIPKKGMKISFTHENKILYKSVIPQYPGNPTGKDGSELLQNKIYCVEKDYYFVMGENYFNSKDSRYWGFLPEKNIIGKASFVLFSLDPNKKGLRKIRWNRMFRKIK